MTDRLDILIGRWTRLGAGFSAAPAVKPPGNSPDLERLLLDTARESPGMARLFIMAATWLRSYGVVIARHRLKKLIREELEPEHHPVLGLLLDIAQQGTHPPEFASVLRTLRPAPKARPLFEIERSDARLAARAERMATELSRRWGLWCGPIELKRDALRPASWVRAHNREFRTRVDLRGDLRASVLASLRFDPGAGASELSLAAAAGGSRAQVRSAIASLELTGRVSRVRGPGRRIGVRLEEAA